MVNKVADLAILETNNGGDILLYGRDMAAVYGFQNMPYLALFGSNSPSTPAVRNIAEQDFSFWGNALFHPNEPEAQFNSLTEQMLQNVALNSAGRLQIEQAVKKDLEFMQAWCKIKVEVAITGVDRIRIQLTFIQPETLLEDVFIFLWDGTESSLTYTAPSELYVLGTESGNYITTEDGQLISLW